MDICRVQETVSKHGLSNQLEISGTNKYLHKSLTSLWLAISLVVFFTSGSPCPGFDDRRRLPVVSPKALWEARTREEWEAEKAMYDAGSPIMTFGELLDVRRGALGRAGMLKYEAWEAESDKMGLLLGLAADLIQGDLQQP